MWQSRDQCNHAHLRKERAVANYTIESRGTMTWSVEADGYQLNEGFFHFHKNGEQVFAVRSESVSSVRADSADGK
jgi:hypothetical protein